MGTFLPSSLTSRQMALLKMLGTIVGCTNAHYGNFKISAENIFHQQMIFAFREGLLLQDVSLIPGYLSWASVS